MAHGDLLQSVRQMSPGDQAISMAVAVLFDRLQNLSAEDRADLVALVKELPMAADEEELCAIASTMLEIFETKSSKVAQLELEAEVNRPEALQKWTQYVAKRVREVREAANMTQPQLSELTGLPQSHISRIENAKLSPSRVTIEKIATALGKSVADFDHSAERPSED